MNVFWRVKGDGTGYRFYEGDLRQRDGGLVKLSSTEHGKAYWYKKDEVELIFPEVNKRKQLTKGKIA